MFDNSNCRPEGDGQLSLWVVSSICHFKLIHHPESYSITLSVADREDTLGNNEANPTIDDSVAATMSVTGVEKIGRVNGWRGPTAPGA